MNTTKRVKKRIQPQVIENKEIIKEVNETSISSIPTSRKSDSNNPNSIQTENKSIVTTNEMLIKQHEEFVAKVETHIHKMEEENKGKEMTMEEDQRQQEREKMMFKKRTWETNAGLIYTFMTTFETQYPSTTTFDWGRITERNKNTILQELIYGTNRVEDECAFVVKGSSYLPIDIIKSTQYENGMIGEIECENRYEDTIQLCMHSGDVLRLRTMPQERNICVTSSSDGNCYLINFDSEEIEAIPLCQGGGYGISWSPVIAGMFATGENSNLRVFNINDNQLNSRMNIQDFINDVSWHYTEPLVLSVSEESKAIITDIRTMETAIQMTKLHDGDTNACSFDPINTHLFITGGGVDGFVKFWDMRKPNIELCHLYGAEKGINSCSLSSVNPGFVLSASKDYRVRLFDMNKVGEDQTSDDADDGGSELLLTHCGHEDEVFEAFFHPELPFVVGSCGNGFDIQLWKPNNSVTKEDYPFCKPSFIK